MSMAPCELETTFVVEFLEKGPAFGYPIAEVFESVCESCDAGVKLKVLND